MHMMTHIDLLINFLFHLFASASKMLVTHLIVHHWNSKPHLLGITVFVPSLFVIVLPVFNNCFFGYEF